MEREIIEVIRYFERFEYPPTETEIYTFISSKISKVLLERRLDVLVTEQKLLKSHPTSKYARYTLINRGSFLQRQKKREKISQEKLKKVSLYLKLLKFIPQIKLVGLSGTLAMMNAEKNDDIDLFIITAKNRLFTGRLIAVVMSYVLGVRRSALAKTSADKKDKVCLNLFFDESNLRVPDYKARPYVAHEILQMKPMIIKGDIYNRFLVENEWVLKIFPNAGQIFNFHFSIFNKFSNKNFKINNYKLNKNSKLKIKNLGDWIEQLLKKLQLASINRHKTSEIITASQLWFHPVDFGKKLQD